MKNKLACIALIFASLLSVLSICVLASDEDKSPYSEAENIIECILNYNCTVTDSSDVQSLINGALTERAGNSGEWYIFSLAQSEEYDFSAYERALLDYLGTKKVSSAASRQKFALVLSAIGSTDPYISSVMNESIGAQGLMSYIYGLHLLNNGYKSSISSSDQVIDTLLGMRKADGGWAVSSDTSDADATAMAIAALAPHYDDTDVKAAVDDAIELLSFIQGEDGDYMSYGVKNPESTAQVLVALCALGIDCKSDGRFIKNGNDLFDVMMKYRLEDGSFSHTEGGARSAMSTSQVLYSALAYLRMTQGRAPLYILDNADADGVRVEIEGSLENGDNEPSPDENVQDSSNDKKFSYKMVISIAIVIAGVALSVTMIVRGRRSVKDHLIILLVAAIAVCAVQLTDVKSKEEYYSDTEKKENVIGSVTVSIRCDTVDGRDEIILDSCELEIEEGDSVYSILIEATKKHRIAVDHSGMGSSVYIFGIDNLYEFDYGDLSGWIYTVNSQKSNVSCADYLLSDGDVIVWHYTLDLGRDIDSGEGVG